MTQLPANSAGMFRLFRNADAVLMSRITQLVSQADRDASENFDKPSCLAAALSIALSCAFTNLTLFLTYRLQLNHSSVINRVKKAHTDPTTPINARILTISVSPDTAGEYIPIMNCIFAAKKD
ncbi:hypothetical protein HK100_010286, partial [Physocladia obscura]